MANEHIVDKHIGALLEAVQITQSDLFVMEQNSVAKKLTGKTLMEGLAAMLDGHGGIRSIVKVSSDGLVDAYRITFSDDSTYDYTVTNGRSIVGVQKTATSDNTSADGGTDTYTISYSDGTTSTFTVTNGAPGAAGRSAYVWIKYASQQPTADNPSIGDIPDEWMGIYSGQLPAAPSDWSAYTWFYVAGKRGLSFLRLNAYYVGTVERYNFSDFVLPDGYAPMVGDLVLMNEGYLGYVYQVFSDSQQADVASLDANLRGPTGATPSLSVGNVATLEPGNDAYVTITGTTDNPKLNFGIPKGEGSLFVFTVTQNEDGSYSADTTRVEVLTAHEANMAVYCDLVLPGVLVDTPVRIPFVSRTPIINELLFEGTYKNEIYQVRYYNQDGVEPYDENAISVTKRASYATPDTYGAKGDGVTDDTAAFRNALRENRVVQVPGGTFLLSDTIVIPENCELALSQDTVLRFVQTKGNCIELRGSATLRGDHGIISVPYGFSGNVISIDTAQDGNAHNSIPPYTRSDPIWKRQRLVSDVNILMANEEGSYRSNSGDCSGTAVYISADGTASINFIWASMLEGLRIAGAFSYGIRAVNFDDPEGNEDNAWNHDMRIEAVIEACEVGISLENCNNAHLAVTFQPCQAIDGTAYAKWGIRLEDAKNTDLGQSCVWDWSSDNTLFCGNAPECEYQHISMYGDCSGAYIRDHAMDDSGGFWNRIYYDNPASMLTAVVSGRKGTIPIDPKYAFYKNYRSGSYYFNQQNLSYRDYHNMTRYDVPVTMLNAISNPDRLYRIGSFTIGGDVENPQSNIDDSLLVECITIEENGYFGLMGWSNLYCDGDTVQHYWSPLWGVHGNRVPVYFYSRTGDTYTIYRLVREMHDVQHIFNCRVSITNARRFVFDFADMGAVSELDTAGTYLRINPVLHNGAPKLAGQYSVVDGKPVVCTEDAQWDVTGAIFKAGDVQTIATSQDVDNVEAMVRDSVEFPYTNLVPLAVDTDGVVLNGTGYQDGTALETSGGIIDVDGYTTTGFMAITPGIKTIRIAGDVKFQGTYDRIGFYDANFALVGSVFPQDKLGSGIYYGTVTDEENTVLTWTLNENMVAAIGAVYMRISAQGLGEDLIVTVDEEVADPKLPDYVKSPNTAEVGQAIVVKAVDENGKPTHWEAVSLPKTRKYTVNILTSQISYDSTKPYAVSFTDESLKSAIQAIIDETKSLNVVNAYSKATIAGKSAQYPTMVADAGFYGSFLYMLNETSGEATTIHFCLTQDSFEISQRTYISGLAAYGGQVEIYVTYMD